MTTTVCFTSGLLREKAGGTSATYLSKTEQALLFASAYYTQVIIRIIAYVVIITNQESTVYTFLKGYVHHALLI